MTKAFRSDHNDGPKFSTSNDCPRGSVIVKNQEGPTGSSLQVGIAVIRPGQTVCVNEGANISKCPDPKYDP